MVVQVAVSYTHLDVYKRQGEDQRHDAEDEGEGGHDDRTYAQFGGPDRGVHERGALLDVYKRQSTVCS